MTQLRNPNLNITYVGGFCLAAVRDAFGIDSKYTTAMEDWQSGNQHKEAPPTGFAVPIYLSLGKEPAGHIAISLPDGRVASSTQAGTHQGLYIHPNLDDLVRVYAGANGGASYLGWSEEVNDVNVIEGGSSMNTRDFVWLVYQTFFPGVTLTEEQITDHAAYLDSNGTDEKKQWLLQKPEEGGLFLTHFHTLEFYDRARGGYDPINFASYCQANGKNVQSVFNEEMPKYQAALDSSDQPCTEAKAKLEQIRKLLNTGK